MRAKVRRHARLQRLLQGLPPSGKYPEKRASIARAAWLLRWQPCPRLWLNRVPLETGAAAPRMCVEDDSFFKKPPRGADDAALSLDTWIAA